MHVMEIYIYIYYETGFTDKMHIQYRMRFIVQPHSYQPVSKLMFDGTVIQN